MSEEQSNLSKFEVKSDNPLEVFSEWQKKAQDVGVQMTEMFTLATSDGCGRVSARYLMLRQLDKDGFVFMTDGRSKKSFDLEQCSRAAMTFLWSIPEPFELMQVRVEGIVKQENFEDYDHLYSKEPMFCKVRSVLCRQGEYVDWDEHRKHHDVVFENMKKNGEGLHKPPSHYVVYKLYPEMIEFFYVEQNSIADRVVFRHPYDTCLPVQVLEQNGYGKSENGTTNGVSNKNNHVNGTKNGHEICINNDHESGHKDENCIKKIQIVDENELNRCFNNSLKIQMGDEKNTIKIPSQDWVHYRIAA